ncbi:MAG: hypothetical protein V1495_00025 [Pseudomonadota bacterium]
MVTRVVVSAIALAMAVGLAQSQAQEICGQGNWECTSAVRDRSGINEWGRCPKQGFDQIACYFEVVDTCVEKTTGKKFTKQYRQFTGACVNSFADCW